MAPPLNDLSFILISTNVLTIERSVCGDECHRYVQNVVHFLHSSLALDTIVGWEFETGFRQRIGEHRRFAICLADDVNEGIPREVFPSILGHRQGNEERWVLIF
jgi:hypothetical protein